MNPFAFDPLIPIPQMSEVDSFRNGAKDHAKEVDQWLGFRIAETEEVIRLEKNSAALNEKETWNHISPQIFQTSYIELRLILESLAAIYQKKPLRIRDLGAAYFRIEFVNKLVFNGEFQIMGFEVCAQRVVESQRVFKEFFKTELNSLFTADITNPDFELPQSDVFFIYDFGTTHDIETIFQKLIRVKEPYSIVVRGARVQSVLSAQFKSRFKMISQNQNFGIWNFK